MRSTSVPDEPAAPAVPQAGLRPDSGVVLAAGTAVVSGVSVFANSYGVHAITSPAVYTTAKNVVAFLLLALLAVSTTWWPGRGRVRAWTDVGGSPSPPPSSRRAAWGRVVGLAYVGVVGGGLAFVLFFVGLARTSATPAAFWHDSLIIWVAVLALPFLGERLRWWNGAAIVLLVLGQVVLSHGVGRLDAGPGQMLILAATGLWAVEVVVAKRLLPGLGPAPVSLARMGIGAVTLLVYLAATGKMHLLTSIDASQMWWALGTGALLAAYVATWMTALARARALDVSSVLVGSVLVTALLQDVAGTTRVSGQVAGLALVAVGLALLLAMAGRRPVAVAARVSRR